MPNLLGVTDAGYKPRMLSPGKKASPTSTANVICWYQVSGKGSWTPWNLSTQLNTIGHTGPWDILDLRPILKKKVVGPMPWGFPHPQTGC